MKNKKASIALISVASALSLVAFLLFLLFETNYFADFSPIVQLFEDLTNFSNFDIYSIVLYIYAAIYVLFGFAALLTLIILGAKKHRYIDILFGFLICLVCSMSALETSLLMNSIVHRVSNSDLSPLFFIEIIIIAIGEICFILAIISFALEIKILNAISQVKNEEAIVKENAEVSNEENNTNSDETIIIEPAAAKKVSLASVSLSQEKDNSKDSQETEEVAIEETPEVVETNNDIETIEANDVANKESAPTKKVATKKSTNKRPVSTEESKAQVASKYNTRSKPRKKVAPKLPSGAVKAYHISQRTDLHKWQVKASGAEKAIKLFATQQEAIQYAKAMAANQGISIRVHGRDGKIRSI